MIKTRIQKVIEVRDWDDLVRNTYGRPYSLQQQDGCKDRQHFEIKIPAKGADEYEFKNDTVNHSEMGVSFKAWLARDPEQKLSDDDPDWRLQMWWRRNFYPCVDMIANDLYTKGLIDAGEYVIDIDW
jgi:hypothetical protein